MVDDLPLDLDLEDGVQQAIYINRRFPNDVGSLLASLAGPGMTVVDVGANIGWTALEAARAVGPTGRVLAFEPGRSTFVTLRRNIELSVMPWLTAVRAACGAEASTATLYSAREASDYSSLQPCIRELTHHDEHVTVVRLDEWLCRAGIDTVHVLKVDVEGGEWDVLRGFESRLAAGDRPTLVLEVSSENMVRFGYRPRDMLDWLEALGYEAFRRGERGLLRVARGDPDVGHRTEDLVLRPIPDAGSTG